MSTVAPSELSVATFNLYLGADLAPLLGDPPAEVRTRRLAEVRRQLQATAFPRRCPAVADVVARERPDLLGVQELCTFRLDGRVLWDFGRLLLDALAERGTPYDVLACVETFGGSATVHWEGRDVELSMAGANALLRRRDCALATRNPRTGLYRSALTTPVLGQQQVVVRRGWCAAEVVPAGDGPGTTVATTHTEAYDHRSRNRQLEELDALLPAGPAVVLADLNTTPEELRLRPGIVDAWVAAGNPAAGPEAATCGQAPDLGNQRSTLVERIDYVLVRGLEVVACRRFGADAADRRAGLWPSDHAGVLATLRR